jgi:hypothetical protein
VAAVQSLSRASIDLLSSHIEVVKSTRQRISADYARGAREELRD